MNVTFDTNVFGPLVSPSDYPSHLAQADLAVLANHLARRTFEGSVSEGSLSIEALDRHVRIDKFFREWATRTRGIVLPQADPVRAAIFQRVFEAGLTVLHVPRNALGSFVPVPESCWAQDTRYPQTERQDRSCTFMRAYSAVGPQELKALGTALVRLHAIDVSSVLQFPGWPSREELVWLEGIVAEYDQPRQFASTERFSRHLRDVVAEWTDVDILASHYGYGLDLFCTLDAATNTGTGGILHPSNRPALESQYGIHIVSPSELVNRLPKGV